MANAWQVRILTHMSDAPALPAGQPAPQQPARPALNPSTVQQIVDMGFPAARAEQALRRVSPSGSVDVGPFTA